MNAKRAMVCAPLMPEYDRESGSRRVFDLIRFLRKDGWAVSFVAENARGGERYIRILQQMGVAVYGGFGPRTEQLIADGRLDLALFAFWHLAEAHLPVVRRLSPRTHVMIDTIDLHFVRNARRLFQSSAKGLDSSFAAELVRELNTYAASDGVLAVSRKEADLISDLCGDAQLAHVVPDSEDIQPSVIPLQQRKGITFLGNFRHPPNVGAAEFLCKEVIPRIDRHLLEEHPVYIVGNALDEKIRRMAGGLTQVRMVGWVPSVLPYLEQARISVIPLLYGAGTKRKMLQALLLGTPTVSTTPGIEGLDLIDGEHVLKADTAEQFAVAVTRLLTENPLWEQLARDGRAHVAARHGHKVARSLLMGAVRAVLSRPARCMSPPEARVTGASDGADYPALVQRLRRAVLETVPSGATVAVASKGDASMIELDGRHGWHYPQGAGGIYAGHYPADSDAAVRQLELLRVRGAQYLVFPATALWWLEYYPGLQSYLQKRHQEVFRCDDIGVVYALNSAASHPNNGDAAKDTH